MATGLHADRHQQTTAHSMTVADLRDETADHTRAIGDDASSQSGSIGIGIATGIPFVPGGSRSAELLELFIESL